MLKVLMRLSDASRFPFRPQCNFRSTLRQNQVTNGVAIEQPGSVVFLSAHLLYSITKSIDQNVMVKIDDICT